MDIQTSPLWSKEKIGEEILVNPVDNVLASCLPLLCLVAERPFPQPHLVFQL